ncbi:MAG: galactokinase [Acidimicrobiia bacterium]
MSPATIVDRLVADFAARFGGAPEVVVRSPGRVNLIGDHTDYNDGLALAMAIERAVWVAARRRDDRVVHAESTSEPNPVRFGLDDLDRSRRGWGAYLEGVSHVLRDGLVGWDGLVTADLPIGAGLSSSAALELATARVFAELGGLEWDPRAMAEACRRAENEWVGMQSGILDQFSSALAEAGTAMLIDFADRSVRHVPLPEGVAVLVLDTSTRRGLVDSAYNARRAECRSAAEALGVESLREADPDQLGSLPMPERARARHVLTENEAVRGVVAAFEADDLAAAGRWFATSHRSLRHDYEVSTEALDVMVAAAEAAGCFGARLTGAGFGGSVVALAPANRAGAVLERAVAAFGEATDLPGTGFVAEPAGGTSVVVP